jgi:hypothetical protein
MAETRPPAPSRRAIRPKPLASRPAPLCTKPGGSALR